MGWSVLGSVQHGRNRILKTSLHFGRFSRAVCHHPQIHAYILSGFERLRTQHRQHARHAHFFAIFAVGKTRLKNATFKSRRRSSRGTCTLYKRLRVSNHFHTLYLICNENLTPTSYTFSEFLSANFRENSEKSEKSSQNHFQRDSPHLDSGPPLVRISVYRKQWKNRVTLKIITVPRPHKNILPY